MNDKNFIKQLLVIALIAYLTYEVVTYWKKHRYLLPVSGDDMPASNDFASNLVKDAHRILVEEKGIRQVINIGRNGDKERLYKILLDMPAESLQAFYREYNQAYKNEGNGTLTKVIVSAPGDPTDKLKTKTSLLKRLRSLNLK